MGGGKMSTVVVVVKNGTACIAGDSLTTFGREKLGADYVEKADKIECFGNSYLGFVGSSAHEMVFQSIFSRESEPPRFKNRLEIFEYFRKLHSQLKKEYYLNPKDEEDDPYESSQFSIMIANPHGIFSIFDLREVYEYTKFWAMGSGKKYALGAMHTVYGSSDSAEEIARMGVEAGSEFDGATSVPITSYTVELAEKEREKNTI